jgi:hypothetical protein
MMFPQLNGSGGTGGQLYMSTNVQKLSPVFPSLGWWQTLGRANDIVIIALPQIPVVNIPKGSL